MTKKFPPDGYTIEAKWLDKKIAPPPVGDSIVPVMEVSHRRDDLISAYDEAKTWIDRGYQVTVFQTMTLLVFKS